MYKSMNAEMNTKINIMMNIKTNMNRIFFRILTVNMQMNNSTIHLNLGVIV